METDLKKIWQKLKPSRAWKPRGERAYRDWKIMLIVFSLILIVLIAAHSLVVWKFLTEEVSLTEDSTGILKYDLLNRVAGQLETRQLEFESRLATPPGLSNPNR